MLRRWCRICRTKHFRRCPLWRKIALATDSCSKVSSRRYVHY